MPRVFREPPVLPRMDDVGRRDALRAAGGVALAAGLSGCIAISERAERATPIDPGEEGTPPGSGSVKDAGEIRLINAAPAPVEWIYSADPLFQDVRFGSVTDYVRVPAGTQRMEVRTVGGDVEPLFAGEFVHGLGSYTFVVLPAFSGEGASEAENPPRRLLTLIDAADVPDGRAAVRFVHASPDAPPVAVSTADGRVLAERVALGETARATLPAGSYALRVAPAGEAGSEDGGGNAADPLATRDVTLRPGEFYTAVGMGYAATDAGSGPGFRVRLYPTATDGDPNG